MPSALKIVGTEAAVCRRLPLSKRDLIHAGTESHCDISNSLLLLLPPSLLSVCHVGCTCSLCDVHPPSDEKLIRIHSYQREAGTRCRHRLGTCVWSLFFFFWEDTENRLMPFIVNIVCVTFRCWFSALWWFTESSFNRCCDQTAQTRENNISKT